MSTLSMNGAEQGGTDWTRDAHWLRGELLRRRDIDVNARLAFRSGEADTLARIMRIDDENATWLRSVVSIWHWPGRPLVGDEAAHAAWLLAQHADRDPGLQRHCLKLLEEAVAAGEASACDLAYLTDRVLLASGGTQIYGTQITTLNGEFIPCRLRDPETVNDRRASVGLESLESYLNRALALYGPPAPVHVICPNCGTEMEGWLPEPGGQSTIVCSRCQTVHVLRPLIPETPDVVSE